jgi:hypothetical protein
MSTSSTWGNDAARSSRLTRMSDQQTSIDQRREELLSLLNTSASLAGLCITIVALMNTFDKTRAGVSSVDDMLAVCAAAFLLGIYLILWTLRSRRTSLSVVLLRVVDGVFLLAMTTMTIAAFLMVHTIW